MDASQTILNHDVVYHILVSLVSGWDDSISPTKRCFTWLGWQRDPMEDPKRRGWRKSFKVFFGSLLSWTTGKGKGEKYSWGSTLEVGMQQSSSLFLEARTPIPKSTKAFRLEGL